MNKSLFEYVYDELETWRERLTLILQLEGAGFLSHDEAKSLIMDVK